MKFFRFCSALVITTISLNVWSQPSTDTVLRFFEVTNTQQVLDSVFAQTSSQIQNMILQRDSWPDGYSDAQKREVADTVAEMTEAFMRERLGWEAQQEPFVALYKKHFTEQELLDAIAFYETESGKSMNEKLPAVTAEAMQGTMALSMQMGPELEKMISDYLATLE